MAPNYKDLIAGAGFSGITLALMLEQAKIDYEVFESSSGVSPLGSAVVLGPTIMPLLEQLGLLERVQKISNPVKTLHLVKENLKRIGEINLAEHTKQTGYSSMVTTRSDFLSLLISQIPSHKIHFSKRIISSTANKDEVVIRCADDTSYKGEILVGADGAFSKIRALLYKQVAKKGILPRNDALALAANNAVLAATASTSEKESIDYSALVEGGDMFHGGHMSVVGVTQPLDVELFPMLQETESRCDTVISDSTPYSWSYFTVPGNRICWAVNIQQDENTLREQQQERSRTPRSSPSPPPSFSSLSSYSSATSAEPRPSSDSEWESHHSSNTAHPLGKPLDLEDCRSFKISYDKTLGDLIDATPRDQIARAVTEQTLFETWHHGRTVLIGDACHRMVSNAAHQGTVNAMLDAVVLGNLIHDLPSASPRNLVEIFKEFQSNRYSHAKAQMQMNNKVGKWMSSQSWTEALMRKFVVRYISRIYQHFCDDRILADRPQANFMPQVTSRGSVHAPPQGLH
ncbi:hypothetical protein BGZ65_007587 [Modicella reniformis]|uniref:FAD-binding domain-containing protein n=1 Tax=Modicella reniformis TaxID=1440133 RepID=A0A9P6J767_9FUNG|nr:hypothetical protein BGZ65_007587 [Modicella reniformis]